MTKTKGAASVAAAAKTSSPQARGLWKGLATLLHLHTVLSADFTVIVPAFAFVGTLSFCSVLLPAVQAFTPHQVTSRVIIRPVPRSLASINAVTSSMHTFSRSTSQTDPMIQSLLPPSKKSTMWNLSQRSHTSGLFLSSCDNSSSSSGSEENIPSTSIVNQYDVPKGDLFLESSSSRENTENENDHKISSFVGPSSLLPSSSSSSSSSSLLSAPTIAMSNLGEFDPSKKIPVKREVLVGDPQIKIKKKEKSVTAILQELAAIQQQGPRKYCILGTRHCSYLHQQIIELLSYALVLSENHVYTSGAGGTNAAAIRGALRAERPDLLTVILPQSLHKQPRESQELLRGVTDLIAMPQNDDLSLDVASRVCNSRLLSETDQLIAFAFHESKTVIEATKEAKKLEMLVTMLFLD